jgi:hypothetical protein
MNTRYRTLTPRLPPTSGTTTAGDISLSAFSDIVLKAWRNPTVTIKNDRIIVKGNIDIDGVVNSTAIQPTDAAGDGH